MILFAFKIDKPKVIEILDCGSDSRATKQGIWKFIIDKCSKVLILKKFEINYKLSKFKVKLRKLTEPFLGLPIII